MRPFALAVLTSCLLVSFAQVECLWAQSNTFAPGAVSVQQDSEAVMVTGRRTSEKTVTRSVLPGFWELGTSMRFSSPSSDASELNLPEVVRLGISGRLTVFDSVELSFGLALPPKRNEVSSDPSLFAGVLMGRLAVSEQQSLYLTTTANRLLQLAGPRDDGAWTELALGWNGRSFMNKDRWVTFHWHTGASAGRALGAARVPWLAEAVGGLALGAGLPERLAEFAVGADFHFPILSGGTAYWMTDTPDINPQTRVDLYAQLGVHLSTGWNVTVSYLLKDRGQVSRPESILPILEGGYDQRSLIVSFSYNDVRVVEESGDLIRAESAQPL